MGARTYMLPTEVKASCFDFPVRGILTRLTSTFCKSNMNLYLQYTASATSTKGGRAGSVVINRDAQPPLNTSINLSGPKEMGGPGNGTNPEQLFSAGYAACYLTALNACAKSAGKTKEELEKLSVEVKTSIGPTDAQKDGKGFALVLEIVVKGLDEGGEEIVHAAHQVCCRWFWNQGLCVYRCAHIRVRSIMVSSRRRRFRRRWLLVV